MKKLLLLIIALISVSHMAQAQKVLVTYFSWGGSTQALAEEIQRQTGADLYRIEPATPYTTDYNTLAYTIARNEKETNARPALKETNKDFSQYDYIFVGCPVWWFDAPMIIHSFLENYRFSGKTIIPFCTYYTATYETLNDIVKATPESKHLEGIGLQGATSYNRNNIEQWLRRIGLAKGTTGLKSAHQQSSFSSLQGAVYNLQGQLVKTNGQLEGLSPGVYLYQGKKVYVP